jgi:hypothetical protein
VNLNDAKADFAVGDFPSLVPSLSTVE